MCDVACVCDSDLNDLLMGQGAREASGTPTNQVPQVDLHLCDEAYNALIIAHISKHAVSFLTMPASP